MAQRKRTKQHEPLAVGFDNLAFIPIGPFGVNASQANTVNQARIILPFSCKIPLVTINATSSANGITAFNIVVGDGAEAASAVLVADNTDVQAPPTTVQTAGTALFQAGTFPNFTGPGDKAVTLVADVPQTFTVSEPDAIFAQNTLLSLRYVSGASVAGNINLSIAYLPVDPIPYRPAEYTTGFWSSCIK